MCMQVAREGQGGLGWHNLAKLCSYEHDRIICRWQVVIITIMIIMCRWQERYFAAKTALQGRDERVAAVAEDIERRLQLLGCTAIEDKLQDGVPQCIERLAAAGIRIWVLTGDKQVLLTWTLCLCREYRNFTGCCLFFAEVM